MSHTDTPTPIAIIHTPRSAAATPDYAVLLSDSSIVKFKQYEGDDALSALDRVWIDFEESQQFRVPWIEVTAKDFRARRQYKPDLEALMDGIGIPRA